MTTSQFSFTKLAKLRSYHWTRSFQKSNINMKLELAFSKLKILTLNITSSSLFQKNRILKPINFHFFHLIVKNCFKKCESFFSSKKKMLQISKLDIHYLKRWINVEQFSDNVEMENKNCSLVLILKKNKNFRSFLRNSI